MTRAEYRKLTQDKQRELARRLQETAEAMSQLYDFEVRVAICKACRVPVIVAVQPPPKPDKPFWQVDNKEIGDFYRKKIPPYYCVDCRGS